MSQASGDHSDAREWKYVPIDAIPPEWRPPEYSPRLRSYATFPVEMIGTIAASLGRDNEILALAISETMGRVSVCWSRLMSSYLEWFEPMGPPGTRAHLLYRPPHDEPRRSTIRAQMVVDYEASLVFLDVLFELTAQAIGKFVGRPMKWRTLLTAAEVSDQDREQWLSAEVARAVRQIQRTVLWARNKAIVHPSRHYVGLQTDKTGNVTYLRLPTEPPSASIMTKLEALLRGKLPDRKATHIDASITKASDRAVTPWMAVNWLDQVAGDLDANEREELQQLREAAGYALPSIREITEVSDVFLSGVVQYFGDRAAKLKRI